MKIHSWTDDQAPEFVKTGDGGLKFFSHPLLANYELGDHIQYKTRLGVTEHEIVDIRRASLTTYSNELQVIQTKKLD